MSAKHICYTLKVSKQMPCSQKLIWIRCLIENNFSKIYRRKVQFECQKIPPSTFCLQNLWRKQVPFTLTGICFLSVFNLSCDLARRENVEILPRERGTHLKYTCYRFALNSIINVPRNLYKHFTIGYTVFQNFVLGREIYNVNSGL